MPFQLSQPTFPAVTALGRRFARWWWRECLDLMPERLVQLVSGGNRQRLMLRADPQGLLFLLSQGSAFVSEVHPLSPGDTLARIDRFLLAQELRRGDVDLGLELPRDALFSRQILLPAETEGAIDAIVTQDLARKTPFRAGDIYSDYAVTEGAGGKTLEVQQWVVRRQFVQGAAQAIGLTIEQIDIISTAVDDETEACIRLRRAAETSRPLHQKLAFAMAFSAIFLALACGSLRYWNQQVALDRLESEIAATSRKAQQVRTLIDQLAQKRNALARLRLQRSEAPGLIDIWNETTRLLPIHTWLSELRLSEGPAKGEPQLTLTGFSSAAPGLVGVIDGSRLLFDAALTSPVALDPAEGKERFTLQAKVRISDAVKDTAR